MRRAFPVVYVRDVPQALRFYEGLLGFAPQYRHPPDGDAVFVSLRRDEAELGLVHESSPRHFLGIELGDGPRFELFVYVDDVDATAAAAREAGFDVAREPEDQPWGERVAFLRDPDGNPVTVAMPATES